MPTLEWRSRSLLKSEHMPELEETFSKLARTKIGGLNTEYEDRLARFLRSLEKTGEIGGPPQGLTVEQIAHILSADGRGGETRPRDARRSEGA